MLEFYQEQAVGMRSTVPWLASLQSQALTELKRRGFPTKQDEEWKYTKLDALFKHPFNEASGSKKILQASDIPCTHKITIHNGLISGQETLGLPQGVLILPLAVALETHADLIKPHLGTVLQSEHGFHALNTAMIHCGLFIYIPAGIKITEPIALNHVQDQHHQSLHLRHLIIAEAESKIAVVEDYWGEKGISYYTNTITEIVTAAKAEVTHYKIQRESKAAFHLGHVSVKQAKSSEFASHSLNIGAAIARSDISITLQEPNAHCLMNGIYAPNEGQHVDHHTRVNHLVPDCSSDQDYKGILKGRSRAVFNGKVVVAQDAQQTRAKQQNKNLLLSAAAEIDTKPQLEIFADDVVCSHGATVGQLDEDALFYLATRGIDRLEASHYLIHAFAKDNLRLIPHQALALWIEALLMQQLEEA